MEESNAEWAELTRDCLTNILSRLSAKDQWLGAMLVCKSWFSAFKEPSLHSVFNLQPYFDLSRKSTLLSTRKFKSKIDSMLQPVVQSTHIFLTQICIQRCSDRSLDLVGQRELDISNCFNLKVLKRNMTNIMNRFGPSQDNEIVLADFLIACMPEADSEAAAIANSLPQRNIMNRFG
ncbi:hypothetical protein KIW84_065718 [Lathyrus oleraceus]|uniref:F-box domain-containing protein n=1 Tax=Pisum sativum TaxID=3888 RepID=A0A9D4WG89_PEA|nr:hypothetical protein KIW84_065718 [Pisum sativum]